MVVTRLTRNQLAGNTARGFESLHLRQKGQPALWAGCPFSWRDGGIRIEIEHPGGVFICQCKHWQIPLFFAVSRKAKNANEYPPSRSPVTCSKGPPFGGLFWQLAGFLFSRIVLQEIPSVLGGGAAFGFLEHLGKDPVVPIAGLLRHLGDGEGG